MRRTRRGLIWELLLLAVVVGGFYLLLVSGAGAELARTLGEAMAAR